MGRSLMITRIYTSRCYCNLRRTQLLGLELILVTICQRGAVNMAILGMILYIILHQIKMKRSWLDLYIYIKRFWVFSKIFAHALIPLLYQLSCELTLTRFYYKVIPLHQTNLQNLVFHSILNVSR